MGVWCSRRHGFWYCFDYNLLLHRHSYSYNDTDGGYNDTDGGYNVTVGAVFDY